MKKQFNKGAANEGLEIGFCVVAVIVLLFTANFHIPNSGQHTGYVTSVEQSGIIWKTWRAYIKTDPQSSQEDSYCVTDPSVVSQLQSDAIEKSSVTVYYSVPWMTWKWQCGYEQSTIQSTDSSVSTSQAQSTPTNDLTTEGANGLACKNEAYAAVNADNAQNKQNNVMENMTVSRTHYSQITGNCYYEINILQNDGSSMETDIRVAPNDDWVAYCAHIFTPTAGTICNERNHYGLETEQQFQQLENTYLTD